MVWVQMQVVTNINKTFLTGCICFLGTNCKRGGYVLGLVEAMGLQMEREYGIHPFENKRYNLLWG